MNESPTKPDEKQLGATSDVITPAECQLGNELNSSIVSAIMADVATTSTVVASGGGGTSSQIEKERDSNEHCSGLVSRENGNEKPRSSADFDGKAPRPGGGGRKRKRREMEGGKNKWVSRREAEPKRKKVM